jgi:hydroxymethylpyrimidine/phosphomethylpyrimidine kinase
VVGALDAWGRMRSVATLPPPTLRGAAWRRVVMPADDDPAFPPVVLTFSASDPSGGAGMQADLLTLASMGCHPLSVVTALTIQDTAGVEGMMAIDSDWVADQARALLEDMPVDAFKIGVLGSVENIAVIAEILSDYPDVPLVLDPVLASGRGDELATEEMAEAMRELLLPQTTILTPNSMEARRLADIDDEDEPSLHACAARLVDAGCEYVLVTGTHEATVQVVNTLYAKSGIVRSDTWPRLPYHYHGSGCTLASAIAAMLANGLALPEAVREAQDYTWHALEKAYRPGMGQHIPDRLFWAREEQDAQPGDTPDSAATDAAEAARRPDARGTH